LRLMILAKSRLAQQLCPYSFSTKNGL